MQVVALNVPVLLLVKLTVPVGVTAPVPEASATITVHVLGVLSRTLAGEHETVVAESLIVEAIVKLPLLAEWVPSELCRAECSGAVAGKADSACWSSRASVGISDCSGAGRWSIVKDTRWRATDGCSCVVNGYTNTDCECSATASVDRVSWIGCGDQIVARSTTAWRVGYAACSTG